MEYVSGLGVTVALAALTATVFYIYWRRLRNNHYWKTKGVPCEDPVPFIGSMFGFATGKTMFQVDTDWYNKFGRIFGCYTGSVPMLFVAEPELVKQIMIKDFHLFCDRRAFVSGNKIIDSFISVLTGETWKRVRSVVTPAFSTGKLKKMNNLILECGEAVRGNFATHADSGTPVDCKTVFGGYTMDVIASAAFGTKLNTHKDPENIFVQNARKVFNTDLSWRLVLFFMFPQVLKFLKVNAFPVEPTEFFSDLAMSIVERRKKTNEVRDDFLNSLMEAQKKGALASSKTDMESMHRPIEKDDDIDDDHEDDENASFFKEYSKNKTISEIELVAQCVIFFLAGYDTTATTLSMVSYYLALNPEHQETLIKEVDRIWAKHETVTAEVVKEMTFTDAVISETLRLAAPAVRLERTALEDYPLGDTGIVVPKGMIIGVPIYAMHRDPEFFPEPEQFKPERFLPENKDQIQPYTYMPFGSGPRNCLGMRFALTEIKLGLLQVFKDFRFETCESTKVPPVFLRGSGLFQPKDVTLKVLRRKT